jgi:hypothetical protein
LTYFGEKNKKHQKSKFKLFYSSKISKKQKNNKHLIGFEPILYYFEGKRFTILAKDVKKIIILMNFIILFFGYSTKLSWI